VGNGVRRWGGVVLVLVGFRVRLVGFAILVGWSVRRGSMVVVVRLVISVGARLVVVGGVVADWAGVGAGVVGPGGAEGPEGEVVHWSFLFWLSQENRGSG